jgi:hypothetical protein
MQPLQIGMVAVHCSDIVGEQRVEALADCSGMAVPEQLSSFREICLPAAAGLVERVGVNDGHTSE